jgi:glycosyltransferase involved in cell wall biosynthesis
MRLCIDASNLRLGGGVTHLVELLRSADAPRFGFETVFVWACRATLAEIDERPWLVKRSAAVLEKHFLRRALWQQRALGALARRDGCDLIFAPGGTFATPFRPIVTMCRNMLPFDLSEMARYGVSLQGLRFLLLRFAQARSFKRASGTIFLTRFAYDAVTALIGGLEGPVPIIPHGIDARFFAPAHASGGADAPGARPLEIVYVSIIDHYKHQDSVARAVTALAARGHALRLTLIGPSYPPALRRLRATLGEVDPRGETVRYLGSMAHSEIHAAYARADIGLFASSCENMPNILLEQMAAGLPIACSNRGPMPEILQDGGVYFDPQSVAEIGAAILALAGDAALRASKARRAQELARQYSWERCAAETFAFLARIASLPRPGAGGSAR